MERRVDWVARFQRLTRDAERRPEILAGLHFLVFNLMLRRVVALMALVHNTLYGEADL